MGYVLPEWEMEWILVNNLELLSPDPEVINLEVIAQQYYLPRSRGYVDILCGFPEGLLVVELKNEFVDDTYVVTHQLHKYQSDLWLDSNASREIKCLLVSTHGFSRQVQDLAQACRVRLQTIPVEDLLQKAWCKDLSVDAITSAKARILQRRVGLMSLNKARDLLEREADGSCRQDVASVEHFIQTGRHDAHGLSQLARILGEVSRRSPIMAHKVFTGDDTSILAGGFDKWFWFFYSVLDRRANAATFVKAKAALQRYGLFLPQEIVHLVNETSYQCAVDRVSQILRESHFPLVADSIRRELAMPSSIVDAALYLGRFQFEMDNVLEHFREAASGSENLAEIIMKDLRKHIYGVGPRIAAQVIRGLCLKGGWKLSMSSPQQLEKCPFNETFSGPARLGLVSSPESYVADLGLLAQRHLSDNCGVLSHALWFIRKRYCLRPKLCDACPVAGFCNHFRTELSFTSQGTRLNTQLTLFPGMPVAGCRG